jgi:hypothetical protein
MRLFRLFSASLLVSFLTAPDCEAQTAPDSVTSAASTLFKNNSSRRFWMGSNYRKEWLTPVKAPVIHLSTESGGLKPTKRGGGKQTKSLRFEDPQGREYTLRSIQKFITSKTLPADLQSEAAADLVQDGVSASYPYSALSVSPLADAAGILHLSPKLVYIPDDPALGEHRADFGNMLALFEKRLPDSVKKGFDTEEVVEKLKDDNDNDVDQLALLKVRILDMFVMDLDRHEGQWTWGAWDNGKGKTYYPIAKDRDQAFYINQGVLPGIVKWPWLVPQLQGFDTEAKNIKRFNFAARNLDRFFLNQLTEEEWKQAAYKFIAQMTDAVIDKAVDEQPKEIRPISGDKIKNTLKARRQHLASEVLEYYRFLAEIVNITGSDKKEQFDVTRNEDGSVLVQVYKITKEGNQSTKMYERLFDPNDTKELRLYGFGGEDKFHIKGGNDKIKIRFIGGNDPDTFENDGPNKETLVYDSTGGENKIVGDFKNKMRKDTLANYYNPVYYQYNQVIPFVAVGYNQDDGVLIGPSLRVIRHGFHKIPYKNSHQFSFRYAFSTKAFNARWYSEYISVFGRKTDLVTDFDVKAPFNTTNFFGYGMQSIYNKDAPGDFRYYRARYALVDLSAQLRKNFTTKIHLLFGPTFQHYSLDENDKYNSVRNITDVPANGLTTSVFEHQNYVGGKISLIMDFRDNPIIPRKGILWQTLFRHLSGINEEAYDKVTSINSEFSFHIPLGKIGTIVNRTGGGHNFSENFEFYQAQYLGMEDNLRGYRKYRFAGQSKFFNNTELRLMVVKLKTYLFPAYLGIIAFVDNGKVWHPSDESNSKMKTGYGGGIWFAPMRRMVFTLTYAGSKEDKLVQLGVGWRF